MDFDVPEAIHATMRRIVAGGVYGYEDPTLYPSLAGAFAAYMRRRYAWHVDGERAVPVADLVKAHGHGLARPTTADRPVLTFSDELVPVLVSTMLVEAITWWLEQGRPSTPREIATRCALLMSALFKEVSTWH